MIKLKDNKILADEIMSDDELDMVAGGTALKDENELTHQTAPESLHKEEVERILKESGMLDHIVK